MEHARECGTPEEAPLAKPCPNPAEADVVPFSRRDALALACAVALGALWFAVFGLDVLLKDPAMLPGVGVTVFAAAWHAALFAVGGRAMRSRVTPGTAWLLVAVAGLALVPALFANQRMRVLDCAILAGASLVAFASLSGFGLPVWSGLDSLGRACGFLASSLVSHLTAPFRALARPAADRRGPLQAVARGLLVALPVLLVAVPLLAAGDSVFGGLFDRAFAQLAAANPVDAVWRVLRVAIVALLAFSLLRAARLGDAARWIPAADAPAQRTGSLETLTVATALGALDAVYLVFCAIQFAYLFFGDPEQIGYADYARSGFFQLVAVAAVNVTALLAAVRYGRREALRSAAVRALVVVLAACTAVMLASALLRMGLYVGAYGLTLLRLLTLFGMAFTAVCLGAAALKAFRPSLRFFRVLFAAGIALWLACNLFNVDALIADYNVDGYLSGGIERIDVEYLGGLSPDALPALDRLKEARPDLPGLDAARIAYRFEVEQLTWPKWSLSYLHAL